jgi:hypothetical protein
MARGELRFRPTGARLDPQRSGAFLIRATVQNIIGKDVRPVQAVDACQGRRAVVIRLRNGREPLASCRMRGGPEQIWVPPASHVAGGCMEDADGSPDEGGMALARGVSPKIWRCDRTGHSPPRPLIQGWPWPSSDQRWCGDGRCGRGGGRHSGAHGPDVECNAGSTALHADRPGVADRRMENDRSGCTSPTAGVRRSVPTLHGLHKTASASGFPGNARAIIPWPGASDDGNRAIPPRRPLPAEATTVPEPIGS